MQEELLLLIQAFVTATTLVAKAQDWLIAKCVILGRRAHEKSFHKSLVMNWRTENERNSREA